jgi:t-SNARE complex subunit (syntaxin)
MPLYFVILLFLSTFKKFQADIVDVNTIFKDLATMVHEQGEMVDSIEDLLPTKVEQ